MPNLLLTSNDYDSMMEQTTQSGLIFCGAFGVIGAFAFLLYIATKEKIYLFFFLFLTFSTLSILLHIQEFLTLKPLRIIPTSDIHQLIEFFLMISLGFYCLFSICLLKLKSKNKFLFRLIQILAVLVFIYGIGYLFFRPDSSEIRMNAMIVSRVIILIMSLVAILGIIVKIKSSVKIFFLAGSSFYFLGAGIAMLRQTYADIPFKIFYSISSSLYLMVGIFLMVISFLLALYLRIYIHYKKEKENQNNLNKLVNTEKEIAQQEAFSLKIRGNPHFLFNYLNVLKYYIQINENKKAIEYLTKFSKMVRNITELTSRTTISLQEELNLSEQYLTLEQIRYNGEFKFKIETDKNLNLKEIMVPPMLLQPFLEERLWEGRRELPDFVSNLEIKVSQNVSEVIVSITGDGESNHNDRKFHREINQQINSERIELFNKNYNSKIGFKSENLNSQKSRTLITIDYTTKNV